MKNLYRFYVFTNTLLSWIVKTYHEWLIEIFCIIQSASIVFIVASSTVFIIASLRILWIVICFISANTCQRWQVVRDQTSIGASQYIGPRTIQQCLDYCNNNTNCVAVDIDVNVVPLVCWTHFNADDLIPDNTYYQQGTNQYRLLTRCPYSAPGKSVNGQTHSFMCMHPLRID